MNRKLLTVILLGLSLSAAASTDLLRAAMHDIYLQNKAASSKVVYMDGRPDNENERAADADSIRNLVLKFYYDQFRNSQDPDMPYFLFMSKGSNLTLGLGGGVRMRAYYDWNGAMPSTAFAPYTIPIPEDPANRQRFNTTPSGTYVNLQLIGHNTTIGSYGLYIEADFTGYQGRDFRLKKSYAVVRDFTVGYATSTFSDPAAVPAVIDAAGPNNKFSNTNVLVRYMPCFKYKWHAGVSIETPATAINITDTHTRAASSMLPDVAALVQYQWAKGQHVRLSGIVRTLSYLTMSDSKRHNIAGWGVQASAVGRPERHLTLYGTFNFGRGYGSLGGDMLYGAYDLVPNPDNLTQLYAPRSFGWCVGAQYNFRPNIFATLAASQNRYLPRSGAEPGEYKYGVFSCANIFWSIMPRLTVAAEYDWGMRKNCSGEHKAASRFNVSAMFTF